MNSSLLFIHALRAAVVLAATLGMMPLLRRAPAAARHVALLAAMVAVLVLPAVTALSPSVHVSLPGLLGARAASVASLATGGSDDMPLAVPVARSEAPPGSVEAARA